jgi:hypothetical protein
MPQWRNLLQPQGGPGGHRDVALPLQLQTSALIAQLQAASARRYHPKTNPSRRGVKHAIVSHCVWYKISGRPVLSITEGEDKPLKYPHMFQAAEIMLLNKIDLLPHLDFDMSLAIANALKVNPNIIILRVSARSGEGMNDWYDWLRRERFSMNDAAVL